MKTYAIIVGGVVTNIIVWDGVEPFKLEVGQTAIDVTGNKDAAVGSTWDGNTFTLPVYIAPPLTELDKVLARLDTLESRVDALEKP